LGFFDEFLGIYYPRNFFIEAMKKLNRRASLGRGSPPTVSLAAARKLSVGVSAAAPTLRLRRCGSEVFGAISGVMRGENCAFFKFSCAFLKNSTGDKRV